MPHLLQKPEFGGVFNSIAKIAILYNPKPQCVPTLENTIFQKGTYMQTQNLFEQFSTGQCHLPNSPDSTTDCAALPWHKHPQFEGVELKHLITAAHTHGQFSYHLVRIAPGKRIGLHTHPTQLETHEVITGTGQCITEGKQITYRPGTLAVLPAKQPHEVIAEKNGLYLFAKFMPALC